MNAFIGLTFYPQRFRGGGGRYRFSDLGHEPTDDRRIEDELVVHRAELTLRTSPEP